MDQADILYGGLGLLKPWKELRIGKLKANVMADGSLRNIAYDGTELIRSLMVSVRDQNWGTVMGQCSPFHMRAGRPRKLSSKAGRLSALPSAAMDCPTTAIMLRSSKCGIRHKPFWR